jgi:hypothetical protein
MDERWWRQDYRIKDLWTFDEESKRVGAVLHN